MKILDVLSLMNDLMLLNSCSKLKFHTSLISGACCCGCCKACCCCWIFWFRKSRCCVTGCCCCCGTGCCCCCNCCNCNCNNGLTFWLKFRLAVPLPGVPNPELFCALIPPLIAANKGFVDCPGGCWGCWDG